MYTPCRCTGRVCWQYPTNNGTDRISVLSLHRGTTATAFHVGRFHPEEQFSPRLTGSTPVGSHAVSFSTYAVDSYWEKRRLDKWMFEIVLRTCDGAFLRGILKSYWPDYKKEVRTKNQETHAIPQEEAFFTQRLYSLKKEETLYRILTGAIRLGKYILHIWRCVA